MDDNNKMNPMNQMLEFSEKDVKAAFIKTLESINFLEISEKNRKISGKK